MNIEFESAINDIIDVGIINEIRQFNDVIIFGAGESGDWVFNCLSENSVHPKCYCDNYQAKWGMIKNGLEVMSFENAMKRFPNAAVCVASMWSEEIIKQITLFDEQIVKRTYDLLTTMRWETSDSSSVSDEPNFIHKNIERFEALYQKLEDGVSRKTLEGLLNYRLTRNKSFLRQIKSEEAIYVDDQIILEEFAEKISHKTIIDGGAFDGDTIDVFVQKWGKNNSLDIHCYEIEEKNCERIREKKEKFEPHKIYMHQAALWSEEGLTIGVEGDGLSGQVDINKADTVGQLQSAVTECIDGYGFEELGFIKLDIEGAEREALRGGEKTIKRCRPILAVCAYHLQDDLLVLSEYIESLNCGYHLFLRHYMYSSGDTVLYAIPDTLI